MAYGNTYNNNANVNRQNDPNVTIYSGYRMNNAESKIDATCMTFRFWKNNLCIGIFPKKNTGNDEIAFDMDNGITIYLSHTKARIFKHELELFLQNPTIYNCVGVPSGQAAISISNGSDYGKDVPVITIRKVAENGEVTASFAYEFKTNFHFSIRNYDGKNFNAVYDDYKYIEVEQLITVLDEYIKAATNAMAFTVMEQRKYSASRLEGKIDALAAGLGVDISRSNNSQRGKYSSASYFNSSSASSENSSSGSSSYMGSYEAATIDDLE